MPCRSSQSMTISKFKLYENSTTLHMNVGNRTLTCVFPFSILKNSNKLTNYCNNSSTTSHLSRSPLRNWIFSHTEQSSSIQTQKRTSSCNKFIGRLLKFFLTANHNDSSILIWLLGSLRKIWLRKNANSCKETGKNGELSVRGSIWLREIKIHHLRL